MSAEEAQLNGLRDIAPQAFLAKEGNHPVVIMPKTEIVTLGGVVVMDLALCPRGHGSYVTRLLLERQVKTSQQLNWQTVMAVARSWHTWSWNNISPDQPWIKIFAEHARLLR